MRYTHFVLQPSQFNSLLPRSLHVDEQRSGYQNENSPSKGSPKLVKPKLTPKTILIQGPQKKLSFLGTQKGCYASLCTHMWNLYPNPKDLDYIVHGEQIKWQDFVSNIAGLYIYLGGMTYLINLNVFTLSKGMLVLLVVLDKYVWQLHLLSSVHWVISVAVYTSQWRVH